MLLAFYFGTFVKQGIWTLVFAIHMVQLFKENTDSLPPVFDKKVRFYLLQKRRILEGFHDILIDPHKGHFNFLQLYFIHKHSHFVGAGDIYKPHGLKIQEQILDRCIHVIKSCQDCLDGVAGIGKVDYNEKGSSRKRR